MDGWTFVLRALVAAGVLFFVGWLAWRVLRDRLDLLVEHGRDSVRHALAFVLMLGTLAGTVWTFSAGHLALSGDWETIVSVGGIAAALELGVIYTGWYIGQLDQRIRITRRADDKAQLTTLRSELMRWFYVIAAISATANLIYRTATLSQSMFGLLAFFLAAFISAGPIVLVILFCIKLRPMPQDYAEIGRQGMQRGLVMVANQAQANMLRILRRIGRGHLLSDAERAQLAMSLSLVRIYASGEQAQALDHVIAQQNSTPQLLDAPAMSGAGGSGGEWLTSADVARLYHTSDRTAQVWMSQTPGRRRQAHSRTWEAPAATIYTAHGVPALTVSLQPVRKRSRNQAQNAVADAPITAEPAPITVPVLQLTAVEASSAEAVGQTSGQPSAQEGYTPL